MGEYKLRKAGRADWGRSEVVNAWLAKKGDLSVVSEAALLQVNSGEASSRLVGS